MTNHDAPSDKDESQPIELRTAVSLAGFGGGKYWTLGIEDFVRFGTKTTADRYRRGDQFDRLEVTREANARSAELRSKRFRIDGLQFRIADRVDLAERGLFAELALPLRVHGERPFFEDPTSFSGTLRCVHNSYLDYRSYSVLLKNGNLVRCSAQEAQQALRQNGVVYHPEAANTTLILEFNGTIDELKGIGRRAEDYFVEIELSAISWEKPIAWGHYRHDAYLRADWDCQKLWLDWLRDYDNPQPVYFITANTNDNPDRVPEIVRATLRSLVVIHKEGKVVGGYKVGADAQGRATEFAEAIRMAVIPARDKQGKKASAPRTSSERAATLLRMGRNLENRKKYKAAIDYYRQVIEEVPDSAEAKEATERIKTIGKK